MRPRGERAADLRVVRVGRGRGPALDRATQRRDRGANRVAARRHAPPLARPRGPPRELPDLQEGKEAGQADRARRLERPGPRHSPARAGLRDRPPGPGRGPAGRAQPARAPAQLVAPAALPPLPRRPADPRLRLPKNRAPNRERAADRPGSRRIRERWTHRAASRELADVPRNTPGRGTDRRACDAAGRSTRYHGPDRRQPARARRHVLEVATAELAADPSGAAPAISIEADLGALGERMASLSLAYSGGGEGAAPALEWRELHIEERR